MESCLPVSVHACRRDCVQYFLFAREFSFGRDECRLGCVKAWLHSAILACRRDCLHACFSAVVLACRSV